MANKYYLRFLIRNHDDLVFGVRESESDRLKLILNDGVSSTEANFFWFNSIDGRSIIINLSAVQAVRFLGPGSTSARHNAK